MQKGFDEQGYEISADAHRILVGGASAEGAFNGVQTLRQLLRPADVSSVNEKAGSSAPFATSATGLGMTSETESVSENRNNGGAAGGARETTKADSSSRLLLGMTDADDGGAGGGARFVNVALRRSVAEAQKKSVKDARNNGASGGGADETAEADSSESRRGPSGPLGMTDKGKNAESAASAENARTVELECPAVAIRD